MPDEGSWEAVDQYFAARLLLDDRSLNRVSIAAEAAGLPGISVSPLQAAFLAILTRAMPCRRVLEIGTLAGFSAIAMAQAMPRDGRLLTLEADPVHAEVARKNVEREGFSGIIEVRQGKALELLPEIQASQQHPFDLVFIDADKGGNADYFEWALKLTRTGALIIVDNVVRGGAVANTASRDASVVGVHRLTDMIAGDPRVQSTAIQTVGVKGYDGFLMAVVL